MLIICKNNLINLLILKYTTYHNHSEGFSRRRRSVAVNGGRFGVRLFDLPKLAIIRFQQTVEVLEGKPQRDLPAAVSVAVFGTKWVGIEGRITIAGNYHRRDSRVLWNMAFATAHT